MAIVKIGTLSTTPSEVDFQTLINHLNAFVKQVGNQGMILTEWRNTTGTPSLSSGSYISHGGVLYIVESEESLSLPSSDGEYYLKVQASGDTLALSWVSDISGYVWNSIYNGLYHIDESQILPYMLIKTGTSIEKWKITNLMQGSGFIRVNSDGAIKQAGGLVVDNPTILAGGLTIKKFLQYGTTYIDIPTLEDLDPLAAGATNIIAGLSATSSETVTKTVSGNTPSPFVFRTSLTAEARVFEKNYSGTHEWGESTVTVTLKRNGKTMATISAHEKRYGSNNPTGAYTETDTQTTGDVDIPCSVGDTLAFIVSIVTADTGGGLTGSGTGSYNGINCDRVLSEIAGETLSLV